MMTDAWDVLPTSVDIFDDIRALKLEQEALRRNLGELESRLEKELQREDLQIKDDIHHLKERALCCPPTVATVTPGQRELNLRLNEDGEYISSCFYSHPLGYKLCLALKSKKIDSPDVKHPVQKTNLRISLLAVDDGTDRIWPFEGTITIRITHTPIVSALSFEFSIREPISEPDLHAKKLPESLKWTCIPEQYNPYRLKYETGSLPGPYSIIIPYTVSNCPGTVHFQIEYISRVSEKGSKVQDPGSSLLSPFSYIVCYAIAGRAST